LRKAEHAFGGGIPECDAAAGIRNDDRVANCIGKLLEVDGTSHGIPSNLKPQMPELDTAPPAAPYLHVRMHTTRLA
jgi:hypothetical protein